MPRLCPAAVAAALLIQPAGACLRYEPDPVSLTGTVRRVMAYGPPNYGENPATDAKEPYLALVLPTPICVEAAGDSPAETELRQLQIVFTRLRPDRSLVGHRVRITGTLFHQTTAHHQTPVLIEPSRIDRQE